MKFYISPSNQPNNSYVIGETNEKSQMEKVAKRVVTLLQGYNCTPILASLNLTIKKAERPTEAHKNGANFYLAIHSNATGNPPPCNATGAVGLYHPQSEKAKKLAEKLVQNLNSVCPVKSNRAASVVDGMKAFNGSGYGEIRSPMEYGIPSALIEVNFHDNPSTAQWIIDSTEAIAQAIVKAIADVFGLKKSNNDAPNTPDTSIPYLASGVVADPDAPLNIRSGPGTTYDIIGSLPNKATVNIIGKAKNGWYIVDVGGIKGYVKGSLLSNISESKTMYFVQAGAYENKENALKQGTALNEAGFDSYIKEGAKNE